MNVSVVIPAYNSAATIAETLRSLCDQTFKGWEAIIVDDGSTDDTLSIVQSFLESDSRFRCARQAHLGVSAARNIGIDHTNYDWLLFLDSDDWILPQHLERLTNVLATDPQVDAVHCGWSHIAPDGRPVDNKHWADSGDLFEAFAHTCAFTIHACVFRKSLAIAVGGFDLSYRTCEDWDFWLRIARTGARFRSLPEALSLYRMRPNSASVDGRQLLKDIIRVLEQACSPDPRVPQVYPAHAKGDSRATLAERKFYSACWAAGLVLGHGESARDLLDLLKDEIAPKMDPRAVAEILFEAVPISRCEGIQDWTSFGHLLMPLIDEFLVALEDRTLTFGLTPVALKALSDLALKHSTQPRPLKFGTTYIVRVDVNQPIPAQSFPASIERLRCEIEFEGERIGMVELPVCDGVVPSQVLADAIAADYSWPILGRFFQRTIYPNLVVDRSATGLSVRRGPLLLTDKLSEKVGDPWSALHDSIGWAVFLQEIWVAKVGRTQASTIPTLEKKAQNRWRSVVIGSHWRLAKTYPTLKQRVRSFMFSLR